MAASPQFLKKGARLRRRLCRRVVKGKVLKMDRPDGRKVLKFDGLSGRGLWYRPAGDEYKVSVTGFTFLRHRA